MGASRERGALCPANPLSRSDHLSGGLWRGDTKAAFAHRVVRERGSFAVLLLAARIRDELTSQLAEEEGLSIEAALVLLVAEAVPNLTQQALAERAALDRTTVSQVLTDLDYDGLISRVRDRTDRRCWFVALTEAGQAQARTAALAVASAELRVFAPLRSRERRRLGELAERALPRQTGVIAFRLAGQSRTRPA